LRIRVLYFASVRERLRRAEEEIELEDGSGVHDLFAALRRAHPPLAEVDASLRFAVNREYVEREHRLADGDEVAVIPPVSGGA
jgi:molybdopterin synthase sulfur carrier subunit